MVLFAFIFSSLALASASLEFSVSEIEEISGAIYLLTHDQVYRCDNCLNPGTRSLLTPVREVSRMKTEALVAIDDHPFLVGDESGYFSTRD